MVGCMNLEFRRDHLKQNDPFGAFRQKLLTGAMDKLQRGRL